MGETLYRVSLPGVGTRIGLDGVPSQSMTEMARRVRTAIAIGAFAGRALLLVEGAVVGRQYSWEPCGGRAITRRRLLGPKYWLTVVPSAGEDCLTKLALDDRMDYGGLVVVAVSPEAATELGERIASAAFSRQWPISDPQRVESMHATADGLEIWWGYPTETERVDQALAELAAQVGIESRFVTARSLDELRDASFVG